MTASPALRERWNRNGRRRREAELAIASRGRKTCPKRLGRGVCGGRLEDCMLRGGRVVTICDRCERKRLGLCRHCPQAVTGKAIYCPSCLRAARRRDTTRYRLRHRARYLKASREGVARYRLTHREQIRDRVRRRGKYYATIPTCRQCGGPVPFPGMGRPRLDCTTCRPGRVH